MSAYPNYPTTSRPRLPMIQKDWTQASPQGSPSQKPAWTQQILDWLMQYPQGGYWGLQGQMEGRGTVPVGQTLPPTRLEYPRSYTSPYGDPYDPRALETYRLGLTSTGEPRYGGGEKTPWGFKPATTTQKPITSRSTSTYAPGAGAYGPDLMGPGWSGGAKETVDLVLSLGLPPEAEQDLLESFGITGTTGITLPSQQTTATTPATGQAGSNDPLVQWMNAFTQEHDGVGPVEYYYPEAAWAVSSGNSNAPSPEEEAMTHAQWDAEWGAQFQRMNGVPPDEDDWKHSYQHRQQRYYSGGPAGGG